VTHFWKRGVPLDATAPGLFPYALKGSDNIVPHPTGTESGIRLFGFNVICLAKTKEIEKKIKHPPWL